MKSQKKIGVILSYMSEGVKIVTNLIYTPIMLRLLGQSEYGLYQLVYSVVSYLNLLSLGFSASYIRFYSKCKVEEGDEATFKLNGMYLTVFTLLAAICVVCGIVMINNIHTILGNGLNADEFAKAEVLMGFMVFNLALTFPNTVFNCIITVHEMFFFQRLMMLLQSIFNPLLTLPLLFWGYGSVGMVSVTTFITVVQFLCNMSFCFKRLKVKFIFKDFNFSLFKDIGHFTFFIFLNQIIDQINWSVDKFLLGRMMGATSVAIYGLGAQINTMYVQMSSSISSVYLPMVNTLIAEKQDDNKLTKLFTKIGRVQFIVLMLVLTGFVFFGKKFVELWGGMEYSDSYYVTLLLITPVTVPLIQNIGIEIQRAMNKHKTRSIVYFFIAIANVFLSIPLIRHYGPVGAAIGTAVSLMAGNILFMNWYYHKHIKINIIYFWKNIISFLPALIIPVILGIISLIFVEYNNIIIFAFGIALYAFVYCCSMLRWGLNDEEKNITKKICKKLKFDRE